MGIKLFNHLRYTGNRQDILIHGVDSWVCTSFARTFDKSTDDKFMYIIQPEIQVNEFTTGYSTLDVKILTEEELCNNFVVLNEDGTEDKILKSSENKKLNKELGEIEKYFDDMSDKDFEKMLTDNGIKFEKMDENTHVYCTNCAFGEQLIQSIDSDTIQKSERCVKCNSFNPEDSCPLKDRPNYISK